MVNKLRICSAVLTEYGRVPDGQTSCDSIVRAMQWLKRHCTQGNAVAGPPVIEIERSSPQMSLKRSRPTTACAMGAKADAPLILHFNHWRYAYASRGKNGELTARYIVQGHSRSSQLVLIVSPYA